MHRLGGVGLAAFEREQQSQRSFAQLSTTLSQTQVTHLHSQLSQFRSALARFATTHRASIARDPAFRHAFQHMCASIGVDPLAGPRRGGWWAELLGLADWQHELGVQIVDVCVSTRARNGGLLELRELLRLVTRLRGGAGEITEEDAVRSIDALRPLGAGYAVVDVGGRKMVSSVVRHLDEDQAAVLAVAQGEGGRVVEHVLVQRTGWARDRARAALENMLLRDGLCWLDEQDGQAGKVYWVMSMLSWDE